MSSALRMRPAISATPSRGVQELLLAALLLFVVLLGGTEAGRIGTTLRAVGALVGTTVIACYLWQMPRVNDLADRMVLAGLLLFLLTCVTSSDTRSSFDAGTSALAYVGAFYLARGAVATRRGGEMAITVMGSVAIVLGLAFLILWGSIWFRWALIPGAGIPPFDLRLPAFLYRHQYPVGMFAVLALPATLLLARRPIIWPVALTGCVASFLVGYLSGGRAIWLAGVVAAVVAVVAALITARGVRGPFNRWSVRLAAFGAVAAIVVAAAAPLLARLAATSTIDLRFHIWQTAVWRWLDSPLVGFGPGTFQREFSMTGYYNRFEPNIPHAHNLVVQTLFEGGVVGLVGLGLVCAGVIVGAIRHGRAHWSSTAALAFFGVVSLADNPAVVPFLVGPLIVWAALASPRAKNWEAGRRAGSAVHLGAADRSADQPRGALGPFGGREPEPQTAGIPKVQRLTLAAGVVVAIAVLATNAAAYAFDRAAIAAASGQMSEVTRELELAAAFDPSFALYHRELGVWRLAEGDLLAARRQLSTALSLNRADSQASRAAALVGAKDGRRDEAIAFASAPVALQATHVENALTLAYIAGVLQDWGGQHGALVAAARYAPWVTASPEWGRAYPNADTGHVLSDAYLSWQGDDDLSTRNLKARAWLAGLVGADTPEDAGLALRVESSVLACHVDQATRDLAAILGQGSTEMETLEARMMLEAAYYGGATLEVKTLVRLRDPGLAWTISHPSGGASPTWSVFYDNRYYDRTAITPPGGPFLPTPGDGLGAWLRDPVSAADRGAPDSGLAKCR